VLYLVSLVVFLLTLGSAGAFAQWNITSTSSGSASHSGGNCKVNHFYITGSSRSLDGATDVDLFVYPSATTGAASTGTASLTVNWTITYTGQAPTPDYVYILTQKDVIVGENLPNGATPGSGTGTVQGSVGGTDADVTNNTMDTEAYHWRVVRLPVTGGVGHYTSTMTISATSLSGTTNQSKFTQVTVSDYVAIDNRGIAISSSLDATNKRVVVNGVATSVANVRSADGTMHGDTIAPTAGGDSLSVTYTPVASGAWAGYAPNNYGHYYWYSSLTGTSDNHGFGIGDPILAFDVTYYNPPAAPSQVDHIYIHVIDDSDGSDGTANYYMTFHNKYEDWNTTSSTNHPAQFVHGATNPDWQFQSNIGNGTSGPQVLTFSTSYSNQVTESGTIGGQLVTQITDPIGFITLQTNASVTSTTSVTVSPSSTLTTTAPPWTLVSLYLAVSYTDLAGTCSIWGTSGYMGEGTWIAKRYPHDALGHAVPSVWFDGEAIPH
jgi:hypothetical protein